MGTDAERSSPSAHADGPDAGGRCEHLGPLDDLVRSADGHHDAGRPVANPRASAQRRRPSVPHGCGVEHVSRRSQRGRWRRRRAASPRNGQRALQRFVQLARYPGVEALLDQSTHSRGADARGVQPVQRHEHPRHFQRELLGVSERPRPRFGGPGQRRDISAHRDSVSRLQPPAESSDQEGRAPCNWPHASPSSRMRSRRTAS